MQVLEESSNQLDAQRVGSMLHFIPHGISALANGQLCKRVTPELAMAFAETDPQLLEDFVGEESVPERNADTLSSFSGEKSLPLRKQQHL